MYYMGSPLTITDGPRVGGRLPSTLVGAGATWWRGRGEATGPRASRSQFGARCEHLGCPRPRCSLELHATGLLSRLALGRAWPLVARPRAFCSSARGIATVVCHDVGGSPDLDAGTVLAIVCASKTSNLV